MAARSGLIGVHTLIGRIERAARSGATLTLATPEGYDTTTWGETHAAARSLAAVLQARGVTPGTHVAILGPTTRPLITAIQATWLTGGCLVMLPLPMRLGSIEAFVDQTRSRIAAADCSLVLIDDQLAPFVERTDDDPPFAVLQELVTESAEVDPADWIRPPEDPDALAVLQFTSGSTAEPKGVMLPHRTICANLDACCEAGGLIDDETFVSWLPLYHDMGLVGLLTIPMTTGRNLVQAAPQDFLSRPSRWMQWISDHGGTMTAGPNFAYALAARALRRARKRRRPSRPEAEQRPSEGSPPSSRCPTPTPHRTAWPWSTSFAPKAARPGCARCCRRAASPSAVPASNSPPTAATVSGGTATTDR